MKTLAIIALLFTSCASDNSTTVKQRWIGLSAPFGVPVPTLYTREP